MLPAGAAVAHQQRLAQVVAALDRHAAQGTGHRLDRDLQRPLGHPLGRDAWRHRRHHGRQLGKGSLHGLTIGGLVGAGTEQRRQGCDGQPTQQQVGIGDRGRTAAAVGRRPRIGTGRLRPHPQPQAIESQDRATTGGHGVDGQHRRLQLQANDLGGGAALPGEIALPVIEMEDIGGGATHVEADDRLGRQAGSLQGPTAHRHGPHHAPGRPREDRVLGEQHLWSRQGTTGAHHPQPGIRPEGLAHLAQIVLQHRRHRRLHHGGLTAGHKPGLAAELVGKHHGLKAQGLQPGAQLQLLAGIAGAVQQGHGAAGVAVGLGGPQLLEHPLGQR